jgi:hypothetical protein
MTPLIFTSHLALSLGVIVALVGLGVTLWDWRNV